ncbi:multicopper oxidase domain-containing protein [Amycolatopsis taiwanensis]|uniref:Multicopper oxidase n=1 Tax=Amycolatopsis taiwanensis TaxID=342230 RepID=A0A9W6R2K9_9PSEU|nr:multicopper oxidase domain-containing protein [Amycolatopsis taiwanensis]GLY68118.1 multicopper oxidase [Amycolatopsis taiwanensis]
MPTRRQFVKAGVIAGTAVALGGPYLLTSRSAEAADAPSLDPNLIPKWQNQLFILPAMPPVGSVNNRLTYQVAERRFRAQVLPPGMPTTVVNGYGNPNIPSSFHAPSFTIENTVDRPTQVTWINQMVDSNNNYLPPLFTTDPTLHWANPPGGLSGRDSTPTFTSTPPPYVGPQPMIVHLHGAHDFEESDGLPETWFLPNAKNIPGNYAKVGSDYDAFKAEARNRWGVTWAPGTLTSVYPNDQRAGTLWFHDHVLGMTRLDVHSGLNGFYILSGGDADLPDGVLPGPRPMPGDPPGKKYYDICLSLSDHSFNTDGSLFFPSKSNLTGPYVPSSDISPYWNSNFQGTVSTVNGQAWPVLNVEQRRYRFRLLDANNFRGMTLKIVTDPLARPGTWAVPTWVIAADAGGLFTRPRPLHNDNIGIFMQTSERVDIVVDFTNVPLNQDLYLINDLVTGTSGTNDVNNVGQIMKFHVVPRTSTDTSLPPDQITGPSRRNLGAFTETHRVSMNVLHNTNPGALPTEQARFQMGRIDASGANILERWTDPISQTVTAGATALWEIWNPPSDTVGFAGGHAFHIHQVEFQITEKERIDPATGKGNGQFIPLQPWEADGEKDTVFAPNAAITRFIAPFDLVSRYIYHCHLVDHEDHEMMRPFDVR